MSSSKQTNKVGFAQSMMVQTLVFRLGSERYGLPFQGVREVFEIKGQPIRMPGAPDFLPGLINHHGKIVPVVDVGRLLGVDDQAGHQAILLKVQDEIVAMQVAQIESLEEVRASGPLIRGRRRAWLRGVLLTLLEPGALIEQIWQKISVHRTMDG